MSMFAFRDFAPRQSRPAGFFQSAESDNLMEAVQQANLWIKEHQVRVMNIETVVFPHLVEPRPEPPSEGGHPARISSANQWYQFIRVWYEFDERPREESVEESEL